MIPTLLLVDDEPSVTAALARHLRCQRNDWHVIEAYSADEAWEAVHERVIDLMVLDVAMPGRSGFDLLEDMAAEALLASIPVIMVTGKGNQALKRRALDIGAAEFLQKPVDAVDLVARIGSVLRLKAATDQLRKRQEKLERQVAERTEHLEWSRLSLAVHLAKVAEMRDKETGSHVLRVGCYAGEVALEIGLGDDFCRQIVLASPLHDIGKVAVPDAILLKRGPLTEEEVEAMRAHCELGAELLSDGPLPMASTLSNGRFVFSAPQKQDAVLEMAARIALHHHEKWNGEGYPHRLRHDAIPLEARIVAVVDAFDALTSDRPYREAVDDMTGLGVIYSERGEQFDPVVVDAFVRCFKNIVDVREELRRVLSGWPRKAA